MPALWSFVGKEDAEPTKLELGKPLDPAGYDFYSRLDSSALMRISATDLSKLLIVFVADVMEQLNDLSAYTGVYHDINPEKLWPGGGRPGIGMSIFSEMCRSARPFLEVVPPIFNNCTEVLSLASEYEARELYWQAVQGEDDSTILAEALEEMYMRVVALNPFIGEPHVMLSQLLFNRGSYAESVHHASCALDLFYQWATQWDKRRSWAQWTGFARMMLLRAKRQQEGRDLLPWQPVSPKAPKDASRLVYLQELLEGFEEFTEKAPTSQQCSDLSY
jgi:hypothetical protein